MIVFSVWGLGAGGRLDLRMISDFELTPAESHIIQVLVFTMRYKIEQQATECIYKGNFGKPRKEERGSPEETITEL